jgi:HD-GYP domain-containing protein (c-di-GMP phosphodiesterase class II)
VTCSIRRAVLEARRGRSSDRPARVSPSQVEGAAVDSIPAPLRRYVATVIAGGIAGSAAIAVAGWTWIDEADPFVVAVLVAGALLAVRYPFQIRHRTHVYVSGAAFLAMIFVLPWPLAGALAVAVALAGRVGLRRAPIETLFNAGQVGAYVTGGAILFAALGDRATLGPGAPWAVAGVGRLGAILLVAVEAHVVNTALVSIAAALHERRHPWRIWLRNVRADLPTQATATSLGIVAAILAVQAPLTLPLLAMPVIFVHRALRNVARLRTDTHDALAALVEVVELRDPYTAGHSRRVAELARVLALDLGLAPEEADAVASAGRVHDVGKVALDARILDKAGPLDAEEMAQMRLHPVHGAAVVAHFAAYGEGHRLVRHHHERWDGDGYPDGLAGEAIPLGARILAVADTFDALTSARPYRAAKAPTEALAILVDGAGRQWDACVVGAFLAHAARIDIPLPSGAQPPERPPAGQSLPPTAGPSRDSAVA